MAKYGDGLRRRPWILALTSVLVLLGLFLLIIVYSIGTPFHKVKTNWTTSAKPRRAHVPLQLPRTTKPARIQAEDARFNGVRVRVYTPVFTSNSTTVRLPGLVYIHGGGWKMGSIEGSDHFARRWSQSAVVVSVGYQLAPQVQFPVPLDECVTATKYFISNATQFNVDPNHIGVIGESAGGNLAAAVSIKLRDDGFEPSLKAQVLLCPVLQGIDFQLPSMNQFRVRGTLTAKQMAEFVVSYLEGSTVNQDIYFNNNHVSSAVKKEFAKSHLNVDRLPEKYRKNYNRTDLDGGDIVLFNKIKSKLLSPYFSPLVAHSVANLPPAFIYTAENDPLRDEALLYVWRLREAGNNLKHVHSETAVHVGISEHSFTELEKFLWNNL